mgnify:CR=1 FL=1
MKTLSFLFLLFLFSSCASFEDPVEVVSYDMKMENINLDEATLRFNMTVHNYTWTPIKIKPSTLEIFVDGEKLGDMYLDEKIRLKSTDGDLVAESKLFGNSKKASRMFYCSK